MERVKWLLSGILKSICILALCLIYNTDVLSQKNNIKFMIHNPFGLEMGYERAIQQHSSILCNVSITAYDFSGLFGLPRGESYMFDMGLRNYLNNDKTLNGLYIEGELGVGRAKSSGSKYIGKEQIEIFFVLFDIPQYASGNSESIMGRIGLNLGYQKRWDVISIDLGIGMQYNTPVGGDQSIPLSDGSRLELPNYINGFTPKVYFGMGFAF